MKNNQDQAINYEWPEFKSDRERIKIMSQRLKNLDIVDSFRSVYGKEVANRGAAIDNARMVPPILNVGMIIKLPITNIGKGRVEFDSGNYKNRFVSNVNLGKYGKFKQFKPIHPIDVEIKKIDKDCVTVDPISPMVNKWINEVAKNPVSQRNIKNCSPITVKNLQLTRGGFIGDAVIPTVSDFVGEDFTIRTFIPGSQIVLNITDDFAQFEGKTVQAFALNYIDNNKSGWSLICSVKEYLKFRGECSLVDLFNIWCGGNADSDNWWKSFSAKSFNGRVTGIINSSKKCGVFVEIPEYNITGMINSTPEEVVKYKPKQEVNVRFDSFAEEMYYNNTMKQMQHVQPYVITDDILEKCSLKPILKIIGSDK